MKLVSLFVRLLGLSKNRVYVPEVKEKGKHSVFLFFKYKFLHFTLYTLHFTLNFIRSAATLPGGLRYPLWLLVIGYWLLILNSPLYAKYSGGQPGKFLSWAAGARSLGMGKAFLAISDDASATYWNPAGMSQLVRKELTGLHVNLWEETNYDFLSYVHPTAKYGVFGINYTALRSGGFEKVLASFSGDQVTLDRNAGTFKDEQSAVTLAYGKKVLENYIENLSAGISTKFISRALDTSKDRQFSFDLSLHLDRLNSYPLSFGFKLQNLLTVSQGDTEDILPLTFRFGFGYKTLRERLILALDLEKNVNANPATYIGAEYWLLNFAAVRMGFELERKDLVESTIGFGLKYKNYSFDYAFALHELGGSHRFSGTWRFGASVIERREEEIRRLFHEGLEAYRQGNYLLSTQQLNKLLDVDPRNKDARNLVSRLEKVIPTMPKVLEVTREAELTRRGIANYAEGDLAAAVNILRYALSLQPQNENLKNTLNRMEKETGERVSEPEKLVGPTAAFGYLDQKLYKALEYIYAKNYDKAILECQEVLTLEPNNVTAMERMGSALFLMNQRELAKKVWLRALELDPKNTVVQRALEQLR